MARIKGNIFGLCDISDGLYTARKAMGDGRLCSPKAGRLTLRLFLLFVHGLLSPARA